MASEVATTTAKSMEKPKPCSTINIGLGLTEVETVVLLRLVRDVQQQATFNDILDADVC